MHGQDCFRIYAAEYDEAVTVYIVLKVDGGFYIDMETTQVYVNFVESTVYIHKVNWKTSFAVCTCVSL